MIEAGLAPQAVILGFAKRKYPKKRRPDRHAPKQSGLRPSGVPCASRNARQPRNPPQGWLSVALSGLKQPSLKAPRVSAMLGAPNGNPGLYP